MSNFKPLYVSRKLINASEFLKWYENQGVKIINPKDAHITVVYSKSPVNWDTCIPDKIGKVINLGVDTSLEVFDNNTLVQKFKSPQLKSRWEYYSDLGCSWDYPTYLPHVTISYSGKPGAGKNLKIYKGKLVFGPEIMEFLDTDWS